MCEACGWHWLGLMSLECSLDDSINSTYRAYAGLERAVRADRAITERAGSVKKKRGSGCQFLPRPPPFFYWRNLMYLFVRSFKFGI